MWIMKLTDAMNTYNPALGLVQDKGYTVEVIDDEENDSFDWKATKNDCQITASDPLRLLALISIVEEKGSDWNKNISNFYDEILKDFYGE